MSAFRDEQEALALYFSAEHGSDEAVQALDWLWNHGSPELRARLEAAFDKSWGGMEPDAIGEDGEALVSAQRLAEYLGCSVDEVRESMERVERVVGKPLNKPVAGRIH